MKKLSLFIVIVSVTVFWIFGNSTEAHAQQSQKIILAGYKHEPSVSTSGTGMATVALRGDTLIVGGKFKNLNAQFSGGYIMVNLRGNPGNQIYRLKAELNEERTGGTFSAEDNRFVLTEAEKDLLKKGDLYINISSFENQKGELRGDISPMGK